MRVDWQRVPPAEEGLLTDTLHRLALFLRLERKILSIILAYALGIGVFSLIVPLTVQEIVNTFAFAIQPVMLVTLTAIMATSLVFMGAFRVLQARAVETLAQRLYTRIAIATTAQLPTFREAAFLPRTVNLFSEAEFLPRALIVLLVDLINVAIGGTIGMTLLVLFHPYFLLYNLVLVTGFATVVTLLGRGGLRITLAVSRHHYDLFNWLQEIGHNLLHFKASNSAPLLLAKTDRLVSAYVKARQIRSDILTGRQYKGAVLWQAFAHSAMLGTAGWLLADGQITLGQFVAAEAIVGALLVNLDTVARRMYALIYACTSFRELARLYGHAKDEEPDRLTATLPDPGLLGLRLTCKHVGYAYPDQPPLFADVNLDIMPGERIAILTPSSAGKTTLALVLAGLYPPTTGLIRYNDVDLRHLRLEAVNACRGIVLDSRLSLFDGTLEENITLGREGIDYADVQWALQFAELEQEVDALADGLQTNVASLGKSFTASQILRILVARAIVTRPQLLVFDGTLHNMAPTLRDTILRRLCSKEEPWSVVFVSNDPVLVEHVDRRILIGQPGIPTE